MSLVDTSNQPLPTPKTARSIEDMALTFQSWKLESPMPPSIHSAPVTPSISTPISLQDFERSKVDFELHFLQNIRKRKYTSKERISMRPVVTSPCVRSAPDEDIDEDQNDAPRSANSEGLSSSSSLPTLAAIPIHHHSPIRLHNSMSFINHSNNNNSSSSITSSDCSAIEVSDGRVLVNSILSACIKKRNTLQQKKKIEKSHKTVSLLERRQKKMSLRVDSLNFPQTN